MLMFFAIRRAYQRATQCRVDAVDVCLGTYSVLICVAIALIDDVDDPLAYGDRALRNHTRARKVNCEPWLDAPSGWASKVRITLGEGRTPERANEDFPGTRTSSAG